MKDGSRVIFTKDIPTWNGKSCKAKAGDIGRVMGDPSYEKVTIVRDGKSNMVYDVPVSSLQVIQ